MRDPFMRASRRIIRRLGKPVVIITENDVRVDLKGIYDAPEDDTLVKGRKGGLVLKTRPATLIIYADEAPELTKECRIIIPHVNREYFPADSKNDGDGGIVIELAEALSEPSEVLGYVSKWR